MHLAGALSMGFFNSLAYGCTGVVLKEWSKCLRGKRNGVEAHGTMNESNYSRIVDYGSEIHRIEDAQLSINSIVIGKS
jgi:hypothetical protein